MITMTAGVIYLFLIVVAVVLLVALNRGTDLKARCKLPGVQFSIDARKRKR